MNKESAKRSIAKTVSWRLIATAIMFSVVWALTGALYVSFAASIVGGVFSTVAYYWHERFWDKTSWGRK